MPARPDDTPTVLGALLHRIASPLGAIANYVHVLPADETGLREGLVDAVERSSRAMGDARAWIDAARAVADHGATEVELGALLDGLVASRARAVALPPHPPRVLAREGAASWILGVLLDEAESRWPAGALVVAAHATEQEACIVVRPDEPDPSPRGAGAEQPGDRMTLADALAVRLGGRVDARSTDDGGPALAWTVPSAAQGAPR